MKKLEVGDKAVIVKEENKKGLKEFYKGTEVIVKAFNEENFLPYFVEGIGKNGHGVIRWVSPDQLEKVEEPKQGDIVWVRDEDYEEWVKGKYGMTDTGERVDFPFYVKTNPDCHYFQYRQMRTTDPYKKEIPEHTWDEVVKILDKLEDTAIYSVGYVGQANYIDRIIESKTKIRNDFDKATKELKEKLGHTFKIKEQ